MTDLPRIKTIAELHTILAASDAGPVVLLKHSTRCPVSTRAHAEFTRFAAELAPGSAAIGVVYVVEERAVSNELAKRLGVHHESPQAFVIRDGAVCWHDSHDRVECSRLAEALAAA